MFKRKENLKKMENKESARKESITEPVFFPVPPKSDSLFVFKVHEINLGKLDADQRNPVDPGKNRRNALHSVDLAASSFSRDEMPRGDAPEQH